MSVGRVYGLALALVASGVPVESLEISVEARSGACPTARVVATPSTPHRAPVPVREWAIEVPGRRVVDLAVGRGWTVSASCPGLWAPEERIEPGSEEVTVRFSLVPAGRLGGRFETAGRAVEEDEVRLRLDAADSRAGAGWEPATLSCPLDRGRFECEVPAGEIDARLAVEGFAPHYGWGLQVPAGGVLDLGALEAIEGASVAGWVRVFPGPEEGAPEEPAGPREASVLVTVEPVFQGAVDGAERRRLEVRGDRTGADERGFFQLTGLAPGTYELTASLPGYSPARVSPVVLDRAEEEVIEDLVELVPLVTLEAYFDPPQDVAGRPWRVRLLGEDRGTAGATLREQVEHGPATVAGYWSARGLAVGPYTLRVEDAGGSIWSDLPVEVTPAMAPLNVQLSAVAVEGEVLLGDEPAAAEVVFGTTTRTPSVRMKSDEEGRFRGVLPNEGEWPLEIALAGRPPQALNPVEVRRGPGGIARVSLRLPDTLLAGEVVTENGEPASGVQVLVMREEARASPLEREAGIEHRRRREASLVTDSEGRFKIEGLLPARLDLMAHDATRASSWTRVEIAEDRDTEPVRLVLRERSKVSGFVVSPDGPVPGAAVVGFSRGRAASLDLFAHGVTGADGSFTIELTAGTERFDLLVAPPGYDVVLRRLAVAPEPLAIEVGRSDSRLVLERVGPGTVVAHGGAELPIEALLSALFPLGRVEYERHDRLGIAGLEPGPYAACPKDRGSGCASGFLGQGAELVLQCTAAEAKGSGR